MPAIYTIKFINRHGSDGTYCICSEKPIVNGEPHSGDVLINAWTRKTVPNDYDINVTIETPPYAWCGNLEDSPAPGVTYHEPGKSEQVVLGAADENNGDALTMIMTGVTPAFELVKAKTAQSGSFSVAQGTDFKRNEHVIIGLARRGNLARITPVAMIMAEQNTTTMIQPVDKYYIKKINLQEGSIIDYGAFTYGAGVIDFTGGPGKGHYTATVTHRLDNGYQVDYSD